jgi:hypothetical protein
MHFEQLHLSLFGQEEGGFVITLDLGVVDDIVLTARELILDSMWSCPEFFGASTAVLLFTFDAFLAKNRVDVVHTEITLNHTCIWMIIKNLFKRNLQDFCSCSSIFFWSSFYNLWLIFQTIILSVSIQITQRFIIKTINN